jgi:hypothetical protein
MAVRLSALRAGRSPLTFRKIPVLISARVYPRAIVKLEGLSKLKKHNALIRNGTRDLPACNIVPQSTTLPSAPSKTLKKERNRMKEGNEGK